MKNLATIVYFVLFLSFMIFAQNKGVEPVRPMKDGAGENNTLSDHELFLMKEKNREIPPQVGIVDQSAAPDALVNDNAGATSTGYFTQSETDILAFGTNVLIGFNDSGSYFGGNSHFTGFGYSTDGGATFIDGGTLPTSSLGDYGDPV